MGEALREPVRQSWLCRTFRSLWGRHKVNSCLELPDENALARLSRVGLQPSLGILIGMVERKDACSCRAAHIISKLAKELDCSAANEALEGLAKLPGIENGQNAADALLAINTPESFTCALRGYVEGTTDSRKCVVSAFKARASPEVREKLGDIRRTTEDANIRVAAKEILLQMGGQ